MNDHSFLKANQCQTLKYQPFSHFLTYNEKADSFENDNEQAKFVMSESKKKNSTANEIDKTEDFPRELQEPRWSVISFEKCEAANLTYPQAEQKLAELERQKISGLCIITDEAAARMSAKG